MAKTKTTISNISNAKTPAKQALQNHLLYSIFKTDEVATARDWYSTTAYTVRDHVIERYDEGVGRCAIKRIKRRGKVIFGAYECKWDESVPEGMREPPDEDGTGFSILIKSPDYILYNNTPMARCSSFGVLK